LNDRHSPKYGLVSAELLALKYDEHGRGFELHRPSGGWSENGATDEENAHAFNAFDPMSPRMRAVLAD